MSSRSPERDTRWGEFGVNVGRRTRDLCGLAAVDYCSASRRATISPVARGCSAVGSASPCQGEGRGFESRHPLEGAMASTPAVEWPSGEATACKAVHTGSIPVSTSKLDPARLAQRESASLTRKRSLVQSQYRAPRFVHSGGSRPCQEHARTYHPRHPPHALLPLPMSSERSRRVQRVASGS